MVNVSPPFKHQFSKSNLTFKCLPIFAIFFWVEHFFFCDRQTYTNHGCTYEVVIIELLFQKKVKLPTLNSRTGCLLILILMFLTPLAEITPYIHS